MTSTQCLYPHHATKRCNPVSRSMHTWRDTDFAEWVALLGDARVQWKVFDLICGLVDSANVSVFSHFLGVADFSEFATLIFWSPRRRTVFTVCRRGLGVAVTQRSNSLHKFAVLRPMCSATNSWHVGWANSKQEFPKQHGISR